MRTLDATTQTLTRSRSRLNHRDLIFITNVGGTFTVGFTRDPETVAILVKSGATGSNVTRTYIGDGAILDMDPIPNSIGQAIRYVNVTLSAIHAGVQDAVRGHDLRFAEVEIHRAYLDPDTGLLAAVPLPRFLGFIDQEPIHTAEDGGESTVTLKLVSATREFTRVNPARRGDAQQRLRTGDRARRFSGVVIDVYWGQTKKGPK